MCFESFNLLISPRWHLTVNWIVTVTASESIRLVKFNLVFQLGLVTGLGSINLLISPRWHLVISWIVTASQAIR